MTGGTEFPVFDWLPNPTNQTATIKLLWAPIEKRTVQKKAHCKCLQEVYSFCHKILIGWHFKHTKHNHASEISFLTKVFLNLSNFPNLLETFSLYGNAMPCMQLALDWQMNEFGCSFKKRHTIHKLLQLWWMHDFQCT